MGRKCFIALSFLLVACSRTPSPAPTVPSYMTIATTPELESIVIGWVTSYRNLVNDQIIRVMTYSPIELQTVLKDGESDLAITGSAPPEGWFVSPLSREQVAVVVNTENEIGALNLDDLQAAFSKDLSTWESFGGESHPIQPIVPLEGDATRTIFENSIMKGHSFSPSAFLAPTPTIMLSLIMEHTGSIGFVLSNDINEEVKQLTILSTSSGRETSQEDEYPLWIELLAVSREEPQGNLRDFIVWLQSVEDS